MVHVLRQNMASAAERLQADTKRKDFIIEGNTMLRKKNQIILGQREVSCKFLHLRTLKTVFNTLNRRAH